MAESASKRVNAKALVSVIHYCPHCQCENHFRWFNIDCRGRINHQILKEITCDGCEEIYFVEFIDFSENYISEEGLEYLIGLLADFKNAYEMYDKLKRFISDEFNMTDLKEVKQEHWTPILDFIDYHKQKEDLENLIKNR